MVDSEIQRRRTFEIIAKWIAREYGITIEFQPNAVPCADPFTKRILLPNNIKEENLDKVLALIMHEAGHVAHSQFKIPDLCSTMEEKNVLNAGEDIRVDNLNMQFLPNIRKFYEELLVWEDEQMPDHKEVPKEHKILCNVMRKENQFPDMFQEKPINDEINQKKLQDRFRTLINMLHNKEHRYGITDADLRKEITNIANLIYGKKNNKTPMPMEMQVTVGMDGRSMQMGGNSQESNANKSDAGDAGVEHKDKGLGKNGGNKVSPDQKQLKGGAGGFCGHEKLFELDPNAKLPLNEVSLTEQTQASFSELLKIKSTHVIPDGTELDTDNLTAFFTGAIDELFKEIKKVKLVKSKILLLLDSSGSMHDRTGLCDTKSKASVLANVVQRITQMLDDIIATEGINVDYDIRGFDTGYWAWTKDEWRTQYMQRNGGGTDCDMAFHEAMEEILKDPTIDGNKIVILVTDGQVDGNQIENIRQEIIKRSSDVKCMILGIGLYGEFQNIIGGRNIIADALADGELLAAIEDMLD